MYRLLQSLMDSFRGKKTMQIFISHSALEGELANYLKSWIEKNVPGCRAFCASFPDDLPPASDWLRKIVTEARSSDLCLVLLSLDSLDKQWLFFEAGLTLGAKDINLVGPVLYGGLKTDEIPGPLRHRHALIIQNQGSFDAFVKSTLGWANAAKAHDDFNKNMPPEVRRLVDHGLYGGLFNGACVEKEAVGALKAQPNQECSKILDRNSAKGEIIAVKAVAVPRPQGSAVHWKFGMHLRQSSSTGLQGRVFEFHSGVHEGHNVWTIYDDRSTLHAFNVPASFENDKCHNLELWFSRDMDHVICVGTDSKKRRVCLKNGNGDVKWRLRDDNWDKIVVKAWGDGHACHIDIDSLEIHRNP